MKHQEDEPLLRLIPATVHGRVLVRRPPLDAGLWLAGFHGYAQNARIFLDTLTRLPHSEPWLIASIQALHPFYHSRTNEVIANWMTREDREHAIADNIAYVDAALADLTRTFGEPRALVFAGFSQGVAMAYRAALMGARPAQAILAVGGDVPPELESHTGRPWPPIVLCAGTEDSFYTPARLATDLELLRSLGANTRSVPFAGGHEWSAEVDEAAGSLLAGIAARTSPRTP